MPTNEFVVKKGLISLGPVTLPSNPIAPLQAAPKQYVDGVATVQSVANKQGDVQLVKGDVGLSNVDNTSDVNKPISTATQSAINLRIPLTQKGAPSGVAPLGVDSKVPLANLPDAYSLPIASTTVLGGVKQGGGVSINSSGVISVAGYTLTPATTTNLGGVKQGSGVTIDSDGVISSSSYTLVPATTSTLGGIRQGIGIAVASNGITTLAPATDVNIGGVKVGASLAIDSNGVLSVNSSAFVSKSGDTMTGALTVINLIETTILLTGTSPSVNPLLGSTFRISIAGNTTFTVLDNLPGSSTVTIAITQTGGSITWPSNVLWEGGTAPISKVGRWFVVLVKTASVAGYCGTATGVFS